MAEEDATALGPIPADKAEGPNLLVVDWDFFFPNPSYSAVIGEDVMLYLWDHGEGGPYQAMGDVLWSNRAVGFLSVGKPLPMAQNYRGFWDRFTFPEGNAPVVYADSNREAGRLLPSTFGLDADMELETDAWATVSLYDAHHDCGYKATGSFERWKARGMVSCEDWMLVHHDAGSRLEVTYPAWRVEIGTVEPPPLVPVHRRVDDGTTEDRIYDAVFLCRSGAWVPPWCDEQFTEFLEAAPNPYPTRLEEPWWQHPRPDAKQEALQQLKVREAYEAIPAAALEDMLRHHDEGED